ncbi:hypothetical protein FMEXI_12808 [Fusarium mexicanum]|uniref:Uncharacterized protein n=1 Tax=Fusarium mexicanum TaxID=751941 RepID=A0A8H5I9F6_9HYPO|nr:hypothetical protein FMEXI_12808 [Fusarium mexicanum]
MFGIHIADIPSLPSSTEANATALSPALALVGDKTFDSGSITYQAPLSATLVKNRAFVLYSGTIFAAKPLSIAKSFSTNVSPAYEALHHSQPACVKNGFMLRGKTKLEKRPITTAVPPPRTYPRTAARVTRESQRFAVFASSAFKKSAFVRISAMSGSKISSKNGLWLSEIARIHGSFVVFAIVQKSVQLQ